MTPMVSTAMMVPLVTVNNMEVCLGLRPKMDIFFLPILLPILSAK